VNELVSVVIPSYEQGTFLRENLESIREQNYKNIEVIIMDGGSEDETKKVVKQYNNIVTIFQSEEDRGQSHALNKAIREANGSIIIWQNSDDKFINTMAIEEAVNELHDSDIDIVYGNTVIIDAFSSLINVYYGICPSKSFFINRRMFLSNQSAFIKRSVFDKVGLIDEGLHYAMDVDFFLRCLNKGMKFRYVPSFWGAYRIHANSKYGSNSRSNWEPEMEVVYQRYGFKKSRLGMICALAEWFVHIIRFKQYPYFLKKYLFKSWFNSQVPTNFYY
jgi:GT2 family glycosyltransferase